jgi:ABC-2 type transport system permease protein
MTDTVSMPSPARVFAALLVRDLTVARREIVSLLVRTALQPLLFVIIFGFIMPRMGIIQAGYTTVLLPGVLGLSLAISAMQSVTMPMVTDFGFTREIEDRLLAPIPTYLVAIEKVVNGILQGLISALFLLPIARLIMGPVPGLTFARFPLLILMTILGGAAFSALGLWLGTAIPPQQIGVMFSVILAPMIMFGCTYYPWAGLRAVPVMQYGVLINPLVYISEGLRASLTPGVPHMPVLVSIAALLIVIAFFLRLGLRSFRKKALG